MSLKKTVTLLIKDERGSALILAISLVVFLSILALGYGVFAATEFQMGVNDYAQWQASYLAEAGINRIIYELRERSLQDCEYLKNIGANHYRFDDNPLTGNYENLTITDNSTGKKIGDVEIELYRNQVNIVIIARGTYSVTKTKKVIEAIIRNGQDDPDSPLKDYIITGWREY